MNKQAKLITALAVVMAALMLLVPLAQTDLGGGGTAMTLTTQSY